MIVLSLCDGMSCGQLALKNLGINVEKYYASEIKPHAIKVTLDNFPNTIELGDVKQISYEEDILHSEVGNFYEPSIDLVMFGSPCQDLSIASKDREGLKGSKSSIFFDCYDILKQVNPKYFLIENVASMSKENKKIFSNMLGVEPIILNSQDVTGVSRKRCYWTNIPITKPLEKRDVCFQDILTEGYTPRQYGRCIMAVQGDYTPRTPMKMLHRYFNTGFTNVIFKDEETYNKIIDLFKSNGIYGHNIKAKQIDEYINNHELPDFIKDVRQLTREEREKSQGLPRGYTKAVSEYQGCNLCGDGWTIPIIEYLFSGLKEK